jgi:phosphatidylethanolamine/phosphatidyl-N-methylethanolamine N-methyltransferase
VRKAGNTNIEALIQMDASALAFPDAHFDLSVAMYVMTVVPDPVRVMHELARVTKPGGRVLIINHFSTTSGIRGAVEKLAARHAAKLGWRPEFPVETIFVSDELELVDQRPVRPFGLFTLLEFVRRG